MRQSFLQLKLQLEHAAIISESLPIISGVHKSAELDFNRAQDEDEDFANFDDFAESFPKVSTLEFAEWEFDFAEYLLNAAEFEDDEY